jgi:hypothetical protein
LRDSFASPAANRGHLGVARTLLEVTARQTYAGRGEPFMSTSAIMIQWGTAIPTRERMALEEFSTYTQWVQKLKKDNKIERYEVYQVARGNFQKLSGMTIIEGNDQQIEQLIQSDDFRARVDRAINLLQNFRVEHCVVGAAVGQQMQRHGSVLQQLHL